MINPTTAAKVGNPIIVEGLRNQGSTMTASVQFNATGSRAIVTTVETLDPTIQALPTLHVTIINTATGAEVGNAGGFFATSDANSAQLNADGTRLAITESGYDLVGAGGYYGTVRLVDTATGATVYSRDDFKGTTTLQFSADGTRAVIVADIPGNYNEQRDARWLVIDTVSGAELSGHTGSTGSTLADINSDGTRVVLTKSAWGPISPLNTVVTSVRVVDTATGELVSDNNHPFWFSQRDFSDVEVFRARFSADGSHVIVAYEHDPHDSLTTVAVLDSDTGAKLRNDIVSGHPVGILIDAAGTVLLTTREFVDGEQLTTWTVIDTTTAASVGPGVSLLDPPVKFGTDEPTDYPATTQLSADGTRAVLTTYSENDHHFQTRVAVLDTTTGRQVGTTAIFQANWTPSGVQLSPDGTHVVVTSTLDFVTTYVTVLSTETGTVGSVLGLHGDVTGPVQFNHDGTRAVVTTRGDANANGVATLVTVIDTTTGSRIGTTVPVPDAAGIGPAKMSDDGTLVVVPTRTYAGILTYGTRLTMLTIG